MDPNQAKEYVPEPSYYTYSPRDAIIYALGSKFDTELFWQIPADMPIFPNSSFLPSFPHYITLLCIIRIWHNSPFSHFEVGANTRHDLHFLYEGHPDFQV